MSRLNTVIILFLTLVMSSCENSDLQNKKVHTIIYGLNEKQGKNTSVELRLTEYESWRDLQKRTEDIVCRDSLPFIILKMNDTIKKIYINNPCTENYSCILIEPKNVFYIHNDSINKVNKHFYPIDSLVSILKKDINNYGKNPNLSDNPKKLLFFISYDDYDINRILNTLNILVNSYSQITNKNNLVVWLVNNYNL